MTNNVSEIKYFKNQVPPSLENLLQSGEKFTDPYFPPNNNSLYGLTEGKFYIDQNKGPSLCKELEQSGPFEWKRPEEISSKKWSLFTDEMFVDDIKQGALGDCYFLAALSALGAYPKFLKRVFKTKQYNTIGYYEIIFFIDGEWQIVIIDDYLVFNPQRNMFAFSQPNNNELWVLLLEKAWAKVNGGFSLIIGGDISDAILSVAGFPSVSYYNDRLDSFELYKIIEEGSKNKALMGASGKIAEQGIQAAHAYTLLKGKSKTEDDLYLVKIRNPWGSGEWIGDWSDTSKKWTNEYKNYFGYEQKEDGNFWMHIDDFQRLYSRITVANLLTGYHIRRYFIEDSQFLLYPLVFNMEVPQKAKINITIHRRHWRFHRELGQPHTNFTMIIGKYDVDKKIQKLDANSSFFENPSIYGDFEEGNYVIWIFNDYLNCKEKEGFRYTLELISDKTIKTLFIGIDETGEIGQYLVYDNFRNSNPHKIAQSTSFCCDFDENLHSKFIMHYIYLNLSENWIEVNLQHSEGTKGIVQFPPFTGKTSMTFILPPYGGAALLSGSTDYSFGMGISCSPKFIKPPSSYTQVNIEKYLKFDIKEEENTLSIRMNAYTLSENMIENVIGENEVELIQKEEKIGEVIVESKITKEKEPYIEEGKKKSEIESTMNQIIDDEIIQTKKKVKVTRQALETDPFMVEQLNHLEEIDSSEQSLIYMEEGITKYFGGIDPETKLKDGRGVYFDGTSYFVGYYKQNVPKGIFKKFGTDQRIKFIGEVDSEYNPGTKGVLFYINGDTYTGEFKKGFIDGNGIYFYNNIKASWMGTFSRGKFHGKGKYFTLNGLIVEDVEYENGVIKQRSGKPLKEIFTASNAEIFFKDMKRKYPIQIEKLLKLFPKKTKEDLLEWKEIKQDNDSVYLGQVDSYNLPSGRGCLFMPKTEESKIFAHLGYFSTGIPNGKGTIYDKNWKIIYSGGFRNGKRNGQGWQEFEDGSYYSGMFKNDKFHGQGVFYFIDGSRFEGNFVDGKREGHGYVISSDLQSIDEILYKNNNIVEKIQKINTTKRDYNREINLQIEKVISKERKYAEMYLSLEPHCDKAIVIHGIKNFQDGYYIGEMNHLGMRHGRGVLVDPYGHSFFVGYFEENDKEGKGCIYSDIGIKKFEGNFFDNLPIGKSTYYLNEEGETLEGDFNEIGVGVGTITFENGDQWQGPFYAWSMDGVGKYTTKNGELLEENSEYRLNNLVVKEEEDKEDNEEEYIYYEDRDVEKEENGTRIGRFDYGMIMKGKKNMKKREKGKKRKFPF